MLEGDNQRVKFISLLFYNYIEWGGFYMKLKFRAEHKDVVAYLWACLLLLFVVALCVRNFYHVADDGLNVANSKIGWTFNLIPAFFPPYLGYTILFWILAIILLTASVSSHFFTREKGFGFVEGKKEEGFGRFAKESEYQNFKDVEPVELTAKESTAAGFPLCYDKKKNLVYVDNGEAHSLVIGATGSGKTQMVINPLVNLLSKKGESMVITDPKGEIYEKNGEMLRDLGYDVIVVNFRDPKNGSCWNPYTLPYKYYKEGNQDKANELLNDMAINIATDEKADDPFWTNSAADYLTGLSLGMFEDASEDEISISTVNLMVTVGEEKVGASTYAKEYFKFKDPASPAAINALGTVNAPQDTKNSVLSVLKQKIKVFAVTQNLAEMLSRSDFDMETIGERKTAIFMIIQDEKTTYHALATIFVKQCYESLIAVAQRHGGKLPVRTNFLLDEFANMPKFKDITTMITAARSRQIRMTMIIQNFAQLVQVYGKEDAETIRGNCGNILYLLTGELSALEEISKLCGDKIVKVGKDKKEETRPLITVTELQRFKQDEVLVLKHRLPPLRTKFLPFWNTDFGYGKNNETIPKAEVTSHEQRPIKLFDIREYVKKKKDEKRNELFGGAGNNPFGNNSPFGGGATPNPFGGNQAPNPFGNNAPTSNSNPLAAYGAVAPTNNNPLAAYGATTPTNDNMNKEPFNPFGTPSALTPTNPSNDDLNIDEMMKKIDARIAELEAEEKAEKDALENEEKASEKQLVEETKTVEIVPDKKDDTVSSSSVIMPSSKIDFNSFGNSMIESKQGDITSTKHDLLDDMIEDLSFDEPLEKLDSLNDKNSEDLDILDVTKDINEKENLERSEATKEDDSQSNIYTNKEEISKIMNKKDSNDDDDDFFNEFFD